MSHKGNVHFTLIISPPPGQVAEGDRIFESHAKFIEKTHHREGDKALRSYNVAKGTNPEGTVFFTLTGIFETEAGIEDHHNQSQNWEDAKAFIKWMETCNVTQVPGSTIVQSLW